MKQVVFDSYALIALFRKEPGYEIVRDLLAKIADDECEGYISAVNVGELYYMMCRKSNVKNAEAAVQAVQQMSLQIKEPGLKTCLDAAALKAGNKISYADAFAAELTIEKKAVLVTGDREFDSLTAVKGFKVNYIR